MADEIRLKFTGDSKGLKKVIKSAEKLIKRLETSTKNSTNRRKNKEKTANDFIRRVRKKTAASAIKTQIVVDRALISSEKKLLRKRKSAQDQANRLRVAATKRTASDERRVQIREITRTLQQEKRLSRRRAKNRLMQVKGRQREEKRLERRHTRAMRKIRSGIFRGVGVAGKIGGLLGLAGGVGAFFKGRETLDFDVSLARISAQAKISVKDQMSIRDSIISTSIAYGVQRDVITRAIEEVVDKSGNLKLAADNVENIAMILRGTKAFPEEIGALFAAVSNAFEMGDMKKSSKEVAEFIEILVAQGDKAQITIANLAGNAEKLFGAFKGAGLNTRRDLIGFGALIQTAGEAGDAAEAATAAARFLDQLVQNQKKLSGIGVKIFEPGTKGDLKELDVIITDILNKTGGDIGMLQKFFNIRAIKPIKILAAEFKATGKIQSFVDLLHEGEIASENIVRKFERVAATPSQGIERLFAVITKLSDIVLLPSLDALSKQIQMLVDNKDKMAELVKIFKDFGDTLKVITIAGSKVAGFVMPIIEKRNLKRENKERFENLENMQQRRQALKGRFWTMQPEKVMKQNLDRIYIDIKNEFKQDETGKVKQNTATVETQVNPDRG